VESLTKRRVDEAELTAMVRRGFGPDAEIADCHELTDGSFNAAYAVRLADGADLVVKVAPAPGLKLLTHEVDLMRTEVDVYAHSVRAGVPAPVVAFADFDRTVVESDYAFLSRVPGRPLHGIDDALITPEQRAAVRREAACLAVRLHTVTGPAYGYPLRDSATWQPTWRAAFGAMVDDLVADAQRLGAPLPAAPERIGELMRRHADALDEVRRPALVHFDLWDGNVFVSSDGAGGWRVTGLIDGERAFYGDPLAELVSLTLPRGVDGMPEVLDGFAEGTGRPVELTGPARRRIALYTTYLYLIMAIESRTRGWDDREWIIEPLAGQLEMLAAGPGGR
jgi:aminoglycoside phosphotransferase (APT) family kinase protein